MQNELKLQRRANSLKSPSGRRMGGSRVRAARGGKVRYKGLSNRDACFFFFFFKKDKKCFDESDAQMSGACKFPSVAGNPGSAELLSAVVSCHARRNFPIPKSAAKLFYRHH